ncbi:LNS2 (Lipin/Ned1/Smp2) domain-containing protein [Ditylenchus destructor]|uniref:LNS2 (Lipin/Ned1/Smp2) domain-containing protein n=1 Tax=Ditylenchus destructor TaxID=166010 RepID=A0AAD4RBR2_9BILA|nr:LNS2 (Lipin/Ned1/Smp2) domain-containing protein [Ditylenchus destructor]
MNSSMLSGAIDVIVVEQPDGKFLSTPFHVRFSKYIVFNSEEKYVDIKINRQEIALKMKLGENGIAYFVEKTAQEQRVPRAMATSPISKNSSTGDVNLDEFHLRFRRKSRSMRLPRVSPLRKQRRRRHTTSGSRVRNWHGQDRLAKALGVTGERPVIASFSDSYIEPYRTDAYREEMVSSKYKNSIRLSSEQLKSMGLLYGSNEARFSVTTKFQGTTWCECHIFLYKQSEMLVISDIDGTITKSDVLGHVIPAIGGTWAHEGVAKLYTQISANGYQMVYLSSRSIGLAQNTKVYLKNVKQGSKALHTLPDGPVLLSPTSILMALKMEVIDRRPDEFKIACLEELKALFPSRQPFYSGFGNKETDAKSYSKVCIPDERIFIINWPGVVTRIDRVGFASDYKSMARHTVDYMFPPLQSIKHPSALVNFVKPNDNAFSWWAISPNMMNRLLEEELDYYVKRRTNTMTKNKNDNKK